MYENIQNIIPRVAAKLQLKRTLTAIDVCNTYTKIAEEVLPPYVLDASKVKSFKDGILTVSAQNSSCAQLLHMHSHRIHQSLNEKFTAPLKIKKIKIELSKK